MQRNVGQTLFDGLLVASLLGVVALVLLPGARVTRVIEAEDKAIAFTREIASRLDAHRAAAERDLDDDGVGETPPIGEIIRPEDGAEPSSGGTAFRKDGYWFTVLVPGGDRMPAQPADTPERAAYAETTYLIAAWPVEPGISGMRAYARTPTDGLLRHAIDGYPYGGPDRPPTPRMPLIGTRGGQPLPLPLASDDWVAPRENVGRRKTPKSR